MDLINKNLLLIFLFVLFSNNFTIIDSYLKMSNCLHFHYFYQIDVCIIVIAK